VTVETKGGKEGDRIRGEDGVMERRKKKLTKEKEDN
jgi:hypothetical protein